MTFLGKCKTETDASESQGEILNLRKAGVKVPTPAVDTSPGPGYAH